MKRILIFSVVLIIICPILQAQNPIKIMPVGNSITAGEHYGFPANAERTGYRKLLYEMLVDSGYNIDFVGSQTHGTRPTTDPDWYDWNNEAYPGKQIDYISNQVKIALPIYKPDILLVHVGTNGGDWTIKPGQVKAMLDMINTFSVSNSHPVTVYLCKIINLFIELNQTPTTQFNNAVADMVAARTGDKINIIMVDMEKGIGLDYTDNLPDSTANPPYEGGDMWGNRYPGMTKVDKFHPNDKGNAKMAVKFYEELIKELKEPEKLEDNTIEGLEVNALKDDCLIIEWATNFQDEDGFIIERASPGFEFSVVDSVNANVHSMTDTTADLTIENTYRVKAFNASSQSLYSSEVTYIPTFYNLSLTIIGEGTLSHSSGTFLKDSEIYIEAIPSNGWEFSKWSGSISGKTNPKQLIFSKDKEVTVTFTEIISSINSPANYLCRFYPNPVTDKLDIELNNEYSQGAEIRMFDYTGSLIVNKKVQGFNHILDLEKLPLGIYLIKVSNKNNQTLIERIVKQ